MKISARNVLPGTITDIKKGATTSHVTIDAKGMLLTASITNEAVEDLGLKVGGPVHAIIKSSDVMVGVDEEPAPAPAAKEARAASPKKSKK